jgi:hypothetical protein
MIREQSQRGENDEGTGDNIRARTHISHLTKESLSNHRSQRTSQLIKDEQQELDAASLVSVSGLFYKNELRNKLSEELREKTEVIREDPTGTLVFTTSHTTKNRLLPSGELSPPGGHYLYLVHM